MLDNVSQPMKDRNFSIFSIFSNEQFNKLLWSYNELLEMAREKDLNSQRAFLVSV